MVPIEAGLVLLPIARAAIASALGQHRVANEDAVWLKEPGACFVTLTQNGQLRGCIGSLEARRSLLEDVKANALAAAFHDPRFAPLSESELDLTDLEVSVLSPTQALRFVSESNALQQLRPGIDGVLLEYGHHRGTFLPQVWDQLPDRAEFLAHLKRKAGLAIDFWDDEITLKRYTVHKWAETRRAFMDGGSAEPSDHPANGT